MTRFRGCIDLHSGVVKQIVGGTLSDSTPSALKTNFTSTLPSSHFAELYRAHGVRGCHVIKLGSGCDAAAEEALAAWPDGLQIGGGINDENAKRWIEKGAEKVRYTRTRGVRRERCTELTGKGEKGYHHELSFPRCHVQYGAAAEGPRHGGEGEAGNRPLVSTTRR